MHVKLLQSCPTLGDAMDCSPPASSAHGILQARILKWVAVPSSKGSSWPRNPWLLHLLHWQAGSLPLEAQGLCVCIHTHTHIYIYIYFPHFQMYMQSSFHAYSLLHKWYQMVHNTTVYKNTTMLFSQHNNVWHLVTWVTKNFPHCLFNFTVFSCIACTIIGLTSPLLMGI